MSNIVPLISDAERIIELAEKQFEEGDELGGISLLKSLLDRTPFNYSANATLAWFYFKTNNVLPAKKYAYMSIASAKDSFEEAEGYKFFRLTGYVYGGDFSPIKLACASAYCKEEGERIIEESQSDLLRMWDEDGSPRFTVVFDRDDDGSEDYYKDGRSAFVNGNFEEAVSLLSKIESGGMRVKALEMIALSGLALREYENALAVADKLFEISENNFVASVVTCSSYLGLGKRDEYPDAFSRLKYLPVDKELYRDVISVAISMESYGDLLFVTDRYLKECPLDANVLYVRAVAKYNLGDTDGCLEDLKLSLNVFEDVLVRKLFEDISYGKPPKRLWVTSVLDRKSVQREMYEVMGRVTDGTATADEIFRVSDRASRSNAAELFTHGIRMGMIVDANATKEYLKRVAIDACVPDDIKMYLISELLFTDVNISFKCLHGGVVKNIDLRPVNLDVYAKELFEEVYKHVALNIYAFDATAIPMLRRAIRRLQRVYKANGGSETANFAPIAAAVLLALNVRGISGEDAVCSLFSVTKEELSSAMDLLKKKEKDL